MVLVENNYLKYFCHLWKLWLPHNLKRYLNCHHFYMLRPGLQSWSHQTELVTVWAMEEIYANVELDKSVKPRPSTNQTGRNVRSGWEIVRSSACLLISHYTILVCIDCSFLCSGPMRFHGCVVFCLGLLCVFLLAGLIGLGVTCESCFQK